MRWLLASLLVIVQVFAAAAQDDKDRITQYLEQALSDLGREVRIEGFRGALSSRATMEKLTVADDKGIWLTVTDAVIDWNRAAVLRGRIEINEISAARIDLPRVPTSSDSVSPEAGTFALPELPVSLRIDAIAVKQVVLGEPIIGTPVSVSVTGSVSLAEGQGAAKLAITRLEGPHGSFELDAGFSNVTRVLSVDLSLNEAANGISANLLNLPGKPALELSVKGTSPIDDFAADVILKSDGQKRLTGRIVTQTPQVPEGGDNTSGNTPTRMIDVDIAGDLTPLFVPQYRAFFGRDVVLKSRISLFADGRVSLDTLTVSSAALRLSGNITLSADRLPEQFSLDAVLQDPDGDLVLLPMSGAQTRVRRATISANFDSNLGDAWSLTGHLKDLQRAEGALDNLEFAASGVIQRGEARQVTARIDGTVRGVATADAALAAALGSAVSLGADLLWRDGQPVDVSNFVLDTKGLVLSGAGTVDGLDSAVFVQGAVQARVADLSRFSAIAGQPLSGGLRADLNGHAALLTGAFDLVLAAVATDLGIGIATIDAALSGESRLEVSAIRNEEGLTLRAATVTANGGEAEASGLVATGKSDLQFKAALKNVGQFVGGLNGPARLTGRALEDASGWALTLDAQAPNATTLTAQIALPKDSAPSAQFDAKIGSVSWIVPDLAGPARIRGTIRQVGNQWAVDARLEGPGGSTLVAAGQIARDANSAALDLNGSLPLALLNRRLSPNSMQGFAQFDLRLDGPLALYSLSGQVRTSGARLSLPGLNNALTGIDATVTLADSSAEIQASSSVATGGQLSAGGRVALQAPFVTDVELQLGNVRITDLQLYETNVNGALRLSGSIPANLSVVGRLVLDRTEIRVPSTGIGAFGEIPKIVHLNESAPVRRTRSYAGLLDIGSAAAFGGGAAIGLDVQIAAENRIFVRGRGLDAELGGQLRLTGTTADVVPQGRFGLIRGRLDILGKRMTLEEGSVQLQGDLIPTLRLVARTTHDDAVLFVIVEGPADAPEIRFVSEPELPEDEVLARLLFGRDVTSISALQAVQMASAVATLAGRGGIGIVERLRQITGFDDLDLTTDAEGGTSLRVGKYISENAYSDVEIDSEGQSRVNLNLELTPSTKLRGQVGSDGSTGIGLFFERDY